MIIRAQNSDSKYLDELERPIVFRCSRLARIGETSIHSFIFIQIRVIDLDSTSPNEPGRFIVCRLGISIHDSIIQYQTRKNY